MTRTDRLVARLERFREGWISNPAAAKDFAQIIRDVHECPRADHADAPLLAWIDEALRTARALGL